MRNAMHLSKVSPAIDVDLIQHIQEKCKELGVDKVFATLENDKKTNHGEKIAVFHFVKTPSYEDFEYIQEAFNPMADIFMWSEVLYSLTTKSVAGHTEWVEY